MAEYIERSAAIKAAKHAWAKGLEPSQYIEALPAADVAPVVHGRLIDVDDLGVGRCSKDVLPAAYCAGWNGLLGLIEKAPTVDAIPVVRCKDCKHLVAVNVNGKGIPTCRMSGMEVAPAEFCSRGEKERRC